MMGLPEQTLRGSYPPLITPFRDGAVDLDTYAKLVDRQCREGSHGVVVNGTTAEPTTLTLQERAALVTTAVAAAGGRCAVVAATGSQSHAETVWLTEQAASAGVDAVLVVTPYFVQPPQRGLVEYFVDVASRSSVPLLVYHIPGRAAVSVTVETLVAISKRAPTFVGMKHAVNDVGFVTAVRRRLGPQFRLFAGLEHLGFAMLTAGAVGTMNAVGNIFPRRVAELYESVASGDLAAGRRLHEDLADLNDAIFWDTNPIPLKYLMKRLGLLVGNEHRLPMAAASPELEARLDELLAVVGDAIMTGVGAPGATVVASGWARPIDRGHGV